MKEEKEKLKVIAFIGGPGSGKGTQCDKIISLNPSIYVHLSTGDLFRKIVSEKVHPQWEIIDSLMKTGNLVTREISNEVLKDGLLKIEDNKIVLLDGFPRTMENVNDWFSEMSSIAGIVKVIYLNATEENMKKRILNRNEGRSDDKIEGVLQRISLFKTETLPLILFFKDKQLLSEINGNLSIEEVYKEIEMIIN